MKRLYILTVFVALSSASVFSQDKVEAKSSPPVITDKCNIENDSEDCYQQALKFKKNGNLVKAKSLIRKACDISNRNFHQDDFTKNHKDKKNSPYLTYCPTDLILRDNFFSPKSYVFNNFKANLPDFERCTVIHGALVSELLPSYFWYRDKNNDCIAQMRLGDDLYSYCTYPKKEVLQLAKNIRSQFELGHFWAKTNEFKGCILVKEGSKKLVYSRSELLSRLRFPIPKKVISAANNVRLSNKRYTRKMKRNCKSSQKKAGKACYALSKKAKKEGNISKYNRLLMKSCASGFAKACSEIK
jgi:hypothetical protein